MRNKIKNPNCIISQQGKNKSRPIFLKQAKDPTASVSDEDFKNVDLKFNAITFFKVMVLINCSMVTLLEVLGVPLGRDAICEMLLKKAIEEKNLKNELSGALASVKFDRVTRL